MAMLWCRYHKCKSLIYPNVNLLTKENSEFSPYLCCSSTFFMFRIIFLLLFTNQLVAQISTYEVSARNVLKEYIIKDASIALNEFPVTITSFTSPRSAGGKHDFFSEGDYWWPDPQNPNGPYIQKDGLTNPDNFVAHRKAMIQFSRIMGALASAYIITKDEVYAKQAFRHAHAWLIDTATRMNPHMLYAQAIHGRFTGRGIGIIDMIQFMEVAQSLLVLEKSKYANVKEYTAYRKWFDQYLNWVTTHQYGIDEKNALNNHGTCWTMQVAAFALFTKNNALLDSCRNRYKYNHLPQQMDSLGGFPRELARTKPYGYSLFNLDAMTMLCQILSTEKDNLWEYKTPDGRSIRKGISFLYPYVLNKDSWPFKQDVMYWSEWPKAQPFLLFGAKALNHEEYFKLWEALDHNPSTEEIIRNLPVRYPLIWF